MLRLLTFGTPVVMRDGVPIDSLAPQRRALVLLAMVATAGPPGVRRDVIAARLWPESDDTRALLSLRQLLHLTHTLLGEPELLGSGPELRLDPQRCTSDVEEFFKATASGNFERAAELHVGPFLDGLNLRRAPGVEEWIALQRTAIAQQLQRALEQLAASASARGAHDKAVEYWRRLVEADPLSARLAMGYMKALAAGGDRAAALRHARLHGALMGAELDSAPDSTVAALAEELRSDVSAPLDGGDRSAVTEAENEQSEPSIAFDEVARVVGRAEPHDNAPIPYRTVVRHEWHFAIRLGMVAAVVVLAALMVVQRIRADRAEVAGSTAAPSAVGAAQTTKVASVAVLPFVNGTAGEADVHASDGMTDELIGALSRVPGLLVIARTSVFALRGQSLDIRAIADTLGVGAVVEGSWRRDGTKLRVSAQLVRASDQAVLWSGRYDRQFDDVLAVQDDIARSIVAALLPRLDVGSGAGVPRVHPGTTDPVAYELYLRGRLAFYSRSTRDGVIQARSYFLQAIARDSNFARAHAGRSDAATRMGVFGHEPSAMAFNEARHSANRALALDNTLAEAHASLGHALYVADFAWEEAERSFERALALDSNAVFARAPFAIGLASQGRFDDGLTQLAIARSIDPLSPSVNNVLGRVLLSAGKTDSALKILAAVVALDPRQDLAWQQLGHAHLLRGEQQLAIAAFERAASLSGARDSAHLAFAHALGGNHEAARLILHLIGADKPSRDALAVHFAIAYAGLGDKDRAFFWLERGYALRASFMVGIASEPALRSLHGDKRWNALLRRMELLPPAPARP